MGSVMTFPGKSCILPLWTTLQLFEKLLMYDSSLPDTRIFHPKYIQATQFFVLCDGGLG